MSQRIPVPEEVGRFYDQFTVLRDDTSGENMHFGYWDNPDSDIPLSEAADRLTDVMTDRLRIGRNSRVLDVGCGVGGPALRIARRTGAQVTGISISREQIIRADALAASAGLTHLAEFRHADAMRLPFPPESFDAAIAVESVFHMPDRTQVLGEIRQALRPGGRLVLTDFVERAPIPAAKRPIVDRYVEHFMMTLAQVDDYPPMLRRAGLRLDEILDISEHTVRQTFSRVSQQIDRTRQSLESESEAELVEQFDHADMADIPEFGSVLVVAHRP
ncbi:cyclopropane-fatty-acyl-phospholipid synthase family protein [Kibdelosporangium persicum]|uniref:Staurosporine biosynthesis methyltransferase StaMB n=1 Tax=Kibdelosporangium persicum TaxID=2698649 RepID=A0ABX2F3V1_9PSEU|nr:methyltransferase domain-containing protein [Kibdelosporangium persicum]NRN65641.1 Staurosporine biosynthesis methyltransferase StaMB [Kibdelosporangium persicum]